MKKCWCRRSEWRRTAQSFWMKKGILTSAISFLFLDKHTLFTTTSLDFPFQFDGTSEKDLKHQSGGELFCSV